MSTDEVSPTDGSEQTIDSLIERAVREAKIRVTAQSSAGPTESKFNNPSSAKPEISGHRPHLIAVGSEKGGTGKSTTAIHLIIGLLRDGYEVGAIDLDARQGTLSLYFDNRRKTAAQQGISLPQPHYRRIFSSALADRSAADVEDRNRLNETIASLAACDFVILDLQGSDSPLSRFGHNQADTLITPINDSFVDLAMLAYVDSKMQTFVAPSAYTKMIWEQNKERALNGRQAIDWIIMRNRLSTLDSRNRRNMDAALDVLARHIGFRLAPGFGERVIFRELYAQGLTLLDIRDKGTGIALTMSHLAALQELRSLLREIRSDKFDHQIQLSEKRFGAA